MGKQSQHQPPAPREAPSATDLLVREHTRLTAPPIEPPVPLPTPSVSPSRIPLDSAEFGPGVMVAGNTYDRLKNVGFAADLAFDAALGCVTFGPHLVPLANVRSMVRAGSGT